MNISKCLVCIATNLKMEIANNLRQDHQRIGFTARLTVSIGPGTKSLFKENSMKFIDLMKEPFKKLSPLEVIAAELADAHLSKLEAETAVEYAQSFVDYNVTRIARLNSRMDEYRTDVDAIRVGGTK